MSTTTTIRRSGGAIALFAALAILVTLLPPPGGRAADHLDAPGLMPPGGDAQADINDLYAFEGADAGSSVFAVTVVPAALAEASFGADILYEIKVDTDGDAVEDESYEFTFSTVRESGAQFVVATHADGEAAADGEANGALVGFGQTNKVLPLPDGGHLYAGLRSDPFFFDLAGFQGSVEGADNDRAFNDGNENDFFLPLDTLAIVIEVPDHEGAVSLWATTSGPDGAQVDRMGRPAINTIVNSSAFGDATDKNVYNAGEPADDGAFTGKVVDVLVALSAGDTEGSYTECQAEALAGVLLPDVLPFDKTNVLLPPPLEGRALEDDVIDTLLQIGTGGDPLGLFAAGGGPLGDLCPGDPVRNANGAINTDGIPAHTDYLTTFPYLGEPHQASDDFPLLEGEDFIAPLDGGSEVPPVETGASGVTALEMSGTGIDHLTIAHNLEAVAAGHIHLAEPGENGPVAVPLYSSEGENADGSLAEGTLVQEDLVAGTIEDLTDLMRGGFTYSNFHTAEYPGGEIRGQIQPLVIEGEPGSRFTDDDGNVHETNIELIAAAEITFGCNPPDNTEYCPDDDITRGEMAAFLRRALNLPDGPDAFTDDDDSIFEGDINAVAAVGITRGCNPPENTEYCPDDDITRGEMAAFIARAWDLPASDEDAFTDDDDSIFEGDINAVAAAGITAGCNPPTNDQFCPDRNMSRAEMASFLARAFGWGG